MTAARPPTVPGPPRSVPPRRLASRRTAIVLGAVMVAALAAVACSSHAGPNETLAPPTTALSGGGTVSVPGVDAQGSPGIATADPPLLVVPTTLVPPELNIPGISVELNIPTCTLTITLQTDSVGFAFDSAAISPNGRGIVATAAKTLTNATQVTVNGYTSSEGRYDYNVRLSVARAQTVAGILQPLLANVPFSVVGHGPKEPVAPNDTEAGRSQNRRVVIVARLARKQCTS